MTPTMSTEIPSFSLLRASKVEDQDCHERERGHIKPYILIYLLWISQPLLLWSLGICEWQSFNSLPLSSVVIRYLFFIAGVHVVLIGPIAYFVYPDLKKISIKVIRQLALFIFLLPPILSFGYFVARVSHSGALYDLVFPTCTIILISVLLFEETKNIFLLSVGLSTSLYLQWFGMSDILGPFKTYAHLVPKSDLFYWIKTALMITTLGFTIWKTQNPEKKRAKASQNNQTVTFIVWMFLGAGLYFVLPFVIARYETDTKLSLSLVDFLFCILPILILGELNSKIVKTKIWIGFKALVVALFVGRAMTLGLFAEATVGAMSWAAYDVIAAVIILVSAKKPLL